MGEKEFDQVGVLIIATICLLVGIVLGYLFWGLNPVEYDEDCLDTLANEICIEEGYESGVDLRLEDNEYECKENIRKKGFDDFLWLEGEKESCIK